MGKTKQGTEEAAATDDGPVIKPTKVCVWCCHSLQGYASEAGAKIVVGWRRRPAPTQRRRSFTFRRHAKKLFQACLLLRRRMCARGGAGIATVETAGGEMLAI